MTTKLWAVLAMDNSDKPVFSYPIGGWEADQEQALKVAERMALWEARRFNPPRVKYVVFEMVPAPEVAPNGRTSLRLVES